MSPAGQAPSGARQLAPCHSIAFRVREFARGGRSRVLAVGPKFLVTRRGHLFSVTCLTREQALLVGHTAHKAEAILKSLTSQAAFPAHSGWRHSTNKSLTGSPRAPARTSIASKEGLAIPTSMRPI